MTLHRRPRHAETTVTTPVVQPNPAANDLGRQDALLRAMFEGHSAAMLLVNPDDGRIVRANQAAARYYGYALSELQTLSIYSINQLPRDEVSRAMAEAKIAKRTRFEFPHKLANGETRRVVDHSSPVVFKDQTLLFSIIHDVTARTQAEAALRASEEKYRLLVETSVDVIWTINEARRFTYVSPSIMQLRGLTPEEAMQETIAEAVCPEFLPRIAELLRRSEDFRGSGRIGFVDHIEIQQPHKNGSRVWVEIIVRELSDENGNRIGALGVSRNMTLRKNAEAQLLEYQRRLEEQNQELRTLTLAIEQSGSTIIITDPEGTILYANPRFEETTGYTIEEALGEKPRILKSGEMDEPHYRAMWEAISSGQIWRGEFHNRRKDGSLYWEAATIAPVTDATGRITNYIAIKEDITERKDAQESLRRYAEQLEAKNAELDAFAHTVAHDLKGPLGTLVGFSELLIDAPAMPEGDRRELLDHIHQTGWQMTQIVDALLLLSAARQKKVSIDPLDMTQLVAAVRLRLGAMIAEHGAKVTVPENWPSALGYAPWVEEVWVNFLSNALKYGGRPPQVELGASAMSDGQVRFWVRDNGPGLSPDEQAKMFAPFTRLGQVSVEGHGLGLSIVRRIIERLNGEVGVESRVGEGSAFFFTLPLASDSPPRSPEPSDGTQNQQG